MKQLLPLIFALFLLSSCKNEKKTSEKSTFDPSFELIESDSTLTSVKEPKDTQSKTAKEFPSELQAVLTAHGGSKQWKKMNNLCFEMKGENGIETHTISLPDRKTKVESKDWSIGYDGKKAWLLRHDVGYEGDSIFYHDLMFYFFSMPFILSDTGTDYIVQESTELDGKIYNTYKVSYKDGVGDSSKDEYKLYFDPETNKMVWLAYTVTLKNQKETGDWNYIKYDKWQETNGLLFPEKITWYKVENGKPKGKEMSVKFDKIIATETVLDDSVFKKPDEAQFVN